MPIPTCSVLCRVHLQEGGPDVGAIVIAKLNAHEVYDGYVVPQVTQGTTDENGEVTLDLFPNELGSVESAYEFSITSRNGKRLRVTAVVPNNPDANLHEIAVLPVFPGKVDGQLALEAVLQVGEEANQAAIDAQNASSDAQSAAVNAASSAAAAQGSETAANNSASSASASASTATTQAGIATTQAGIATTQAGIAAAAAASIDPPTVVRTTGDQTIGGIKTFSSSPLVPDATTDNQAASRGQAVLKSGSTMTGHLEVPAAASGNQAPRASETVRLLGGAAKLPTWNTAGRPASPATWDSGINTDLGCIEWWNETAWQQDRLQVSSVVATTSGSSHEVAGIPAWAREVTLHLDAVATNGTADLLARGGEGSLVTTGYDGSWTDTAAGISGTSTAGAPMRKNAPGNVVFGRVTFSRVPGTNRWIIKGSVRRVNTGSEILCTGILALSDPMQRVGIASTDTFNAGQIWATWE